jgi:hypothetical protein
MSQPVVRTGVRSYINPKQEVAEMEKALEKLDLRPSRYPSVRRISRCNTELGKRRRLLFDPKCS